MKKKFSVIIFIIVIVAILAGLGACTTLENEIKIQDSVVSRFGDGFAVLNSNAAPRTATEYKDVSRVTAKVNVDARMSGYHITGLYLPAGESLTITVPNTVRSNHYSVYVDTYSSERRTSKTIAQGVTQLTSAAGGIVEILVPPSDELSDVSNTSFNMTIEGGIVIPYYRLGKDSIDQIEKGDGAFAVLDCVNTRFYVPTSALYDEEKKCKIDDLYSVLLWWQSAVSFVNETLGIESSSRDYTSSIVFGDFPTISYDPMLGVTYAPTSYFESALFFSSLKNGEAWDMLYNICNYKTRAARFIDGVLTQESFIDALCAIEHVVMTNPSEDSANRINWLNNSYDCLEGTLELLQLPAKESDARQREINMAFFINILHSFGLDKTMEIISEYRKETEPLDADGFALLINSVLRADVSLYFDMFGMEISQSAKNKMSGNHLYIPVQTLFTIGNESNDYAMGYTVAMGEKATFDFADNIISVKDGWKVDKVVGSRQNLWTRDADKSGLYYYSPSQDALSDEFYLTISNGEHTVTLYGKINVIITVATYKIYEGWKFSNPSTALYEAIDGYGKRTPDYVGSIDYAGVGKRSEVNNGVYVLTVTSGCIRVPQSGKYRFYLRNNGRCKVDFGVPKYMFTMFDISIPFQEFTRGHSFDIYLAADTNYYFNLYLLSTKGSSDAALGIRNIDGEGEDAEDDDVAILADIVDSKYLIYNGLSQDKIIAFTPPVIYPMGYGSKDAFDKDYELTEESVLQYPRDLGPGYEIEYAFDELRDSYYTAYAKSDRFEFVIDMDGSKRMEYVRFFVKAGSSMVGKKVEIFLSSNADFNKPRKTALTGNVVKAGINSFIFNASSDRYVKVIFYSDEKEQFECSFTDFAIGQTFDESLIVPNTSSDIAYIGGWIDVNEYVCVNGSVSQSVDKNSVMSFTALTRQICVYGVKDAKYGEMEVYVDGSRYTTIDLHSETTMTDQLLFAMDFDLSAEHSIKLMPHKIDDKINVDYISYIPIVKEEIREYTGFLYGVLAIPGIIVIVLICAVIADSAEKKKRNAKKFEKPKEQL